MKTVCALGQGQFLTNVAAKQEGAKKDLNLQYFDFRFLGDEILQWIQTLDDRQVKILQKVEVEFGTWCTRHSQLLELCQTIEQDGKEIIPICILTEALRTN